MRAPEYNEIPTMDTITIYVPEGESIFETYTSTKGRYIVGECLVSFTKFVSGGLAIEVVEIGP